MRILARRMAEAAVQFVSSPQTGFVPDGWLQGQGGVALVTHVPSASQLDSFDESHTVGKLF